MFSFATDYFLLVFAATVGVVQIAASVGELRGLLFFKGRLTARALGLVVVVAAFGWFFASGTRNLNDYEGGLDANSQALFFFFGSSIGVLFTLVLSSLVNLRARPGNSSPESGLEALKETSYARALTRSAGYWWRNWRTRTKGYFSG